MPFFRGGGGCDLVSVAPTFWVAPTVAVAQTAGPTSAGSASTTEASTDQGPTGPTAVPSAQRADEKTIVVVTGTFEPAPLEELNRSVGVIPVRESASLHHYWTEDLQSDASLDLRQRGPNGIQGDLSVRGSTFGQTLILLDGLRVNDAQTAHHNLDLPVPLDGLERIEVLRGAGSTLYGADAMGGAVNFITAKPEATEVRFGAQVGNFGVNSQNLDASFLRGGVSEQLTLWRDFSSGFRPDREYRSTAAFSRTSFSTALGNTTLLLGTSDKPFGADQFYCNCDSFERTKAWFTGLRQGIGKNTEFDFGYRRHSDEFVLLLSDPTLVPVNNHIDESYQFALRRRQELSTNTTLSFGAEGFRDSIDSNDLGQHSRARGAGYVNLDARALGRLSLSVGAREELFGSDAQFTPSVAAGYSLRAGWRLKGSVGRAFRIPTYTDLYHNDPFNQGNPKLKPESGWSYEGGLGWNPGGRWRGEATVFQSRESNVIDYVRANPPTNPKDPYTAANLESLIFTGFEGSVHARLPRGQQISVGYTGIHGARGALQGLNARYTSNYPTHRAVLGWDGELPGQIHARSQVGVDQRFGADPYAIWDAAVTREFYGRVRANFGFSNLSDAHYEEIANVAMPGRSVTFGLDLLLWRKEH